MPFRRKEVDALLFRLFECRRRCCVCHRWCGTKIELDHIVQKADGGSDDIENAIPVCFECHAEIHSYNQRHPRGRKYRAAELRRHREGWLKLCREHPEILLDGPRRSEVGPLQALLDELEFNLIVTNQKGEEDTEGVVGCRFMDAQFRRAIRSGSIAMLEDRLQGAILNAYAATGRANSHIAATFRFPYRTQDWMIAAEAALAFIEAARPELRKAKTHLLRFARSE